VFVIISTFTRTDKGIPIESFRALEKAIAGYDVEEALEKLHIMVKAIKARDTIMETVQP